MSRPGVLHHLCIVDNMLKFGIIIIIAVPYLQHGGSDSELISLDYWFSLNVVSCFFWKVQIISACFQIPGSKFDIEVKKQLVLG